MKKIVTVAVYCALLSIACTNGRGDQVNQKVTEEYNAEISSNIKSYFLYHEIKNVDYDIYI